MSQLITLRSTSNVFSFIPAIPLKLKLDKQYTLALRSFHSYNSIPNIESGHNKFYYYENGNKTKLRGIVFPTGSYEIEDIEKFIQHQMGIDDDKSIKNPGKVFSLKPNNNTLKCEIFSNTHIITFTQKDNIGDILGFSQGSILESNITHSSNRPVKIIKVTTIRFDCNITTGAFYEDRPAHTIYEFAPLTDPGFAINETPSNLLYLPIINQREITNITVRALDQNSMPVNVQGEESILILEFKENGVDNTQ